MKSIIIPLPISFIKNEEQETLYSQSHLPYRHIETPQQSVKRSSYYKDAQSTASQQSTSTKMILMNNGSSTASQSNLGRLDESFNHYSHYIKHFQNGFLQSQEREVNVAYVSNRKQKCLTILPYAKLVSSVSSANIEKKNDNFIQEWINFMENYNCENIGLNLIKQNQTNNHDNSYKFSNLHCFEQGKKVFSMSKKNQKLQQKNVNQVNIQDIVTQFYIPEFIEELVINKFCLYIQSSYKILKSNDLEKQTQSIDQQMYNLIFHNNSNNNSASSMLNDNSSTSLMNSSVCHGSNTLSTKKVQLESSDSLKDQKKYHFNMSKYFMLFILELFRNQHLSAMQNLPQSIIEEILQIVCLIQQISKKNNSSKTNYYNHYHYDVLFLQINEQTKNSILRNSKLLEMHQQVFRVADLNDSLSIQRINIIKQYMTQILLSQLSILKKKVQIITKENKISKTTLEDINSKIDYLYRVEQGIIELNLGKTINRF